MLAKFTAGLHLKQALIESYHTYAFRRVYWLSMKILRCVVVIALFALGAELSAAQDTPQQKQPMNTTVNELHGTLIIRADSVAAPGSVIVVGVAFADTTISFAGFSLNIEYDRGALVFDSATLGSLTTGEWEYFMTNSGLLDKADSVGSPGFVRLVGLADQQDEAKRTPKPRSLVGPGEIAKLYFYVGDRAEYQGKSTWLRFAWGKCDDNSFSDPKGLRLFLCRKAYDVEGKLISSGTARYSGPSNNCFRSKRNPPERWFDFRNARILIK